MESTWQTRSPTAKLIYCADFAAKKHKLQKRKDPEGTPYINHPIGVARNLTEEGGVEDLDIIQAALLHDCVEDTDTTFEELEFHFGPVVTGIVREVTDQKEIPKAERKRLQVLNAPKLSKSAKTLRMADKIYNLRDQIRALPRGWTEQRRREYFVWAEQVAMGVYDGHSGLAAILQNIFVQYKESIANP